VGDKPTELLMLFNQDIYLSR